MTVESSNSFFAYKPGGAMLAQSLTGLVYLSASDLVVYHISDATGAIGELVEGADYTLGGNGALGSGTITAAAAYPADDLFRVERRTGLQQPERFDPFRDLDSASLERGLDRLALVNAEQARDLGRTLSVPIGENPSALPAAANRANNLLGFDANGNPIALSIGDTELILQAQRREFVATDAQTDFAFNSTALAGYVTVYINGVRLPSSDFTLADATVTLAVAAQLDDLVAIEGFVAGTADTVGDLTALLSSAAGAGEIGLSTGRTVEQKAGETVSVMDFGGVGDGAADDTAAFQAAVDALGARGGEVLLPNLTFKITAPINITTAVFVPVTFRGQGATRIVSTHDGIVFNDSALAIRVIDLEMAGPGLGNVNAVAIKSGLTRGRVTGCKIFGYRLGIDATGTSGAWIVDNQISLCQEAIRIKSVNPAFSNIIMIAGNYLDYNTFGIWAEEVYGLVLDTNAFEYNAVGLYALNARLIDVRGNNWFEAHTTNAYQIVGACTGRIGRFTRIVGNDGTIAHATSTIVDETRPALALVKRAAALNVAHNLNENIAYDTETLDAGGLYSASVFTVTTPGTYEISANAEFAAVTTPSATTYGKLMLNINAGGAPSTADAKRMIDGVPTQLGFTVLRKLNNGDAIRIQAYQNSGGALALTVGDQTSASVRLVQPA